MPELTELLARDELRSPQRHGGNAHGQKGSAIDAILKRCDESVVTLAISVECCDIEFDSGKAQEYDAPERFPDVGFDRLKEPEPTAWIWWAFAMIAQAHQRAPALIRISPKWSALRK